MAATLARSALSSLAVTPTTTPATSRPVRTSQAALMLSAGPPVHRLQSLLGPRAMADLADGGEPLAAGVRARLEQTFGVSLGEVRVRTDQKAQQAVAAVGARAFAHGHHIFLGPGESPSDLALLAHEVAHVVQQHGSVPAMQMLSRDGGSHYEREAHQASAAAVSGSAFTVRERTADIGIQRFGKSDALDWIAEHANNIQGFRMLTIILGTNPVNLKKVERSPANVLRALIELIPGGALITQVLDSYGIIDKVGNWVSGQLDSLGLAWTVIKQAVTEFIASLKLSDVFNLDGVWNRAISIFTTPINRIIDFGKKLVDGIVGFVKDAILAPLAALAAKAAGWDLLCAILGKNPITGEVVPRDAETLIGGFMKLIHQEEIWENIQKGDAIHRAWAWFQKALESLMGFVRQVPALFMQTLKSLELADIVVLTRGFAKVAAVFGDFAGNFIVWAGTATWNLLEIIFDVVSPGALEYIKKTGAALKSILKNPLPFVGNLAKAAKLGFQNFADHIGEHLKNGLIDWLTGSLPGIYIPKAFSLTEILKFALSVLGLTWDNLRGKLVKAVGEPAVALMEAGFNIVLTLKNDGPAAAWDQIKEQLSNLKEMVIGGITDFVIDMVAKKAVPKIVAMFIPGPGFISAILSIYDMVMVVVEKIKKIIAVVKAFVDSIVQIAAGDIGGAAKKVETTLAGVVSLAINFVAGFLGLGKVADKIMAVIEKIRAPINKALDFLIGWVVGTAKKLFAKAFSKDKKDERTAEQKQADLDRAIGEAKSIQQTPGIAEAEIRKRLPQIKQKYRLKSLELVIDTEDASSETVHVEGVVNPPDSTPKQKLAKPAGSEKNPIEFPWVKPPISQYPTISFVDSTKGANVVVTARPLDKTKVGGIEIGVTNPTAVRLEDGASFKAGAKNSGDSQKSRMNQILKDHQYDRSVGGPKDNDHVWEKQLGGPDEFSNLWPLDEHTNRSSGGTIRAAIARIKSEHKLDSLNGLWLKLKKQ